MDLKLSQGPPLQSERAAADGVLGSPESPRRGRHLLLPALLAVQGSLGWVSQEAMGYICRRLEIPPSEAYGVASFYALLSLTPCAPAQARVCDDVSCRLNGARILCAELEKTLGPEGTGGGEQTFGWKRSNCLGYCERGPSAMVTRAGVASCRRSITASVGSISTAAPGVGRLATHSSCSERRPL